MDEDFRKETILIVDDTLPTIDLIKTVLEDQGYDVMVATSGEKAIQRAGLKAPDLILLDVMMQGIDGYETCLRFKAEECTRDIPVIFMTARSETESKIKGFEAGAVDYVIKPIDIEEVLRRVKIHLSLCNMRQELEKQNRQLQQKIEERQQAEENIRKLNAELEQRVEERTAFLRQINEQLTEEIEERKRAEEDLRTSEERYRALYENNPSMYFTVDAGGMVLSVNPFGAEQLGYTIEELIGQSVLKVFYPDDREAVQQKLKECLQKRGQVTQWVFRKIRKDGSLLWVEEYTRAVVDPGGVPHVLVVCNDMTERKQVEEALRQEKAFTDNALDTITDAFIVFDLNGNFIRWNKVLSETTGYNNDEIISMKHTDFFTGNDRQRVATAFESIIKEGRVSIEATVVSKEGRQIPFEFTGGLLKDYNESPLSVCIVGRDITERRSLEQQLRQAQKMEAIGTLAGGIAHDFNNILAIIVGCSELSLLKIPKDSQAYGFLLQIHNAANRATDLVQQILTFSRGRTIEKKPIQLAIVVKEILKMLRASLPSTIQIDQNIAPDSGMTLADPTQIHQIIMNLCTNAAHAMRDHGGVLRVSLSNIDINSGNVDRCPEIEPGTYLMLNVSDTGHGMNREVLERIFDPYFTTKGPGEGTGLGLAVVHGIVESFKGIIRVHSKPGKGTAFEIFLPRIDHPSALENIRHRPEELPLGHEKILFVDDEQVIVDLAKEMLKLLGYEVVITTSSIDALRLFRSQPDHFDLIITDMTMPHMTGDTLAGEILKIRPDMPVILSTGFSDRITGTSAKAFGFQEYLAKPVAIHELANTVRAVLDKRKSKIEK